MVEVRVASRSELLSALSSATGGETIIVANGSYGDVRITKDYSSEVTIKSATTHGASFGKLEVVGGSNVAIDGVFASSEIRATDGAANVSISNSKIDGQIYIKNSDYIDIDNNEVYGNFNTVTLNSVKHFEITNNHIHDAVSDLVRVTGDSSNGLIEDNRLINMLPFRYADGTYVHADAIQMFAVGGVTPSDIVIRGNVIHDDPSDNRDGIWGQGIFLSDGGYRNILIEENMINVGTPNSIYLNSGDSNVVVRHNTLIPWEDGGGGVIRLASKSGPNSNSGVDVYGNVAKSILNETGKADVGDNYVYGGANLASLFQGRGDGDEWRDYLPVDGSAIDFGNGYGATARLTELLGGGSTPTRPEPDPDPVEEPADQPGGAGDLDVGVVYENAGVTNFRGNLADTIQIAPSSEFQLEEATIRFTFNADSVGPMQGLVSKDASFYSGGGEHFVAYIQNGSLIARFQNGSSDAIFRKDGLKAGVDYDAHFTFGDGEVSFYLNGGKVGQRAFDADWTTNVEYLQFGANGWGSASGEDDVVGPFKGEISDIVIFDQSLDVATAEAAEEALANGELSPPAAEPGLVVQFGEVTAGQPNAGTWTRVDFETAIEDAVVVMGPPSSNGGDSFSVRVKDVDANGFWFQLDEWNYMNQEHVAETLSWMAMPSGEYELADGRKVSAGKTETSHNETKVDLEGFSSKPLVFAQISSVNGADTVVERIDKIQNDSFFVRVQEEEAADRGHTDEEISWIAIEQGDGDGIVAGVTPDAVNHGSYDIDFGDGLDGDVFFIADMQTFDGVDPAVVRYKDFDSDGATIYIDEERSLDEERFHTSEAVGYLVVDDDSMELFTA